MTDLAVKLIERLLAGLTAQTARDVLAAGYSLAGTIHSGTVTTANSFAAADAFMAERERRNRPGIPEGSKETP